MAAPQIVTRGVTAPPRARRRPSIWQQIWRMRLMYLFILPAVILLVWWEYIPAVLVFKEAFYDWDGFRINNFIGLANFREIIHDPVFHKSLRNIFIILVFYLTLPFAMPIVV